MVHPNDPLETYRDTVILRPFTSESHKKKKKDKNPEITLHIHVHHLQSKTKIQISRLDSTEYTKPESTELALLILNDLMRSCYSRWRRKIML